MDSLRLVLAPALSLGIPGLLFVVWYFDLKARERDRQAYQERMEEQARAYQERIDALLRQYREDTRAILARYQEDMAAQRRMYENNVELVKQTQTIAQDLKDLVVLNTQAWQAARSDILNNQFCPLRRLETEGAEE